MFSWLRLVVEAISLGGSVLRTEGRNRMDLPVFTQLYLFIAFCLYGKCEHMTRVQDGGGKELACGTLKARQ